MASSLPLAFGTTVPVVLSSWPQLFIDAGWHELRISVDTAPLDFQLRDRTGDDGRIGQQKPAARFQWRGDLVKERLAVANM
jgi:hypothetical protein